MLEAAFTTKSIVLKLLNFSTEDNKLEPCPVGYLLGNNRRGHTE